MENLEKKKVPELKSIAKGLSIKGYSRMKKDELISALSDISARKLKSAIAAAGEACLKKTEIKKTPEEKKSRKVTIKTGKSLLSSEKIQKVESPAAEPEKFIVSNVEKLTFAEERISRKFDTGHEVQASEIQEEMAIPESYGKDRLVLLPRDSSYLFCYWELNEETIQKAVQGKRKPQMVLKIRIADSKEVLKNVDLRWKKYYLNVSEKGVPYRAELGIRSEDGMFHLILSSNVVFSSPDSVSMNTEEIFLTIPFEKSLKELAGKGKYFYISPYGKLLSEAEYKKLFDKGFVPGSYYGKNESTK